MSNSILYAGLVFAQVLTFVAYAVVTAGAALLQKKANTLTLFDGLDADTLKATQQVYNDVFQSTAYIIPYPQRPQYQFQYEWWIIQFELFIFLITAVATLFPSLIGRIRPVALTFLASALVLVMDNINAIFYLLRSDLAKTVFDGYRIKTAQAGLILVGAGNMLTIICMGLYNTHESIQVPQSPDSRVEISIKNAAKGANAV